VSRSYKVEVTLKGGAGRGVAVGAGVGVGLGFPDRPFCPYAAPANSAAKKTQQIAEEIFVIDRFAFILFLLMKGYLLRPDRQLFELTAPPACRTYVLPFTCNSGISDDIASLKVFCLIGSVYNLQASQSSFPKILREDMAESITELLIQWRKGDKAALDELMPVVYDELQRLARVFMGRERQNHTLQTSALINEAYLRLVDHNGADFNDRSHFFAVAAQVMRHILIDHARSYLYQKRGGGAQKVELEEALVLTHDRAKEIVDLDEALKTLTKLDPRRAQVVELRFFGGLDIHETARYMDISPTTVQREWRAAKVWLRSFMSESVREDLRSDLV
jgi:RNA polymerase sigma-70 factor (ECF subfamily)